MKTLLRGNLEKKARYEFWFPHGCHGSCLQCHPPLGFPSENCRGQANISLELWMSLTFWSEWTCAEGLTRVYPNSRAGGWYQMTQPLRFWICYQGKGTFFCKEFWNSLPASLLPSAVLLPRFSLRLRFCCPLLLILLFILLLLVFFFFFTFISFIIVI